MRLRLVCAHACPSVVLHWISFGPLKGISCYASQLALTCRPTPFQCDPQWEEVGNLEVGQKPTPVNM